MNRILISVTACLLAVAPPAALAAQVAVPPAIIRRAPPPIDTTDLMAYAVRDLTPEDSSAIYRVVLSAGLTAVLATTDPRARPVYLDDLYPSDAADSLLPLVTSGAIRRVCSMDGRRGCPSETAHSVDLLAPQVVHRDTILVPYAIDARRRYEIPMELVDPGWTRSRELEVGIFAPLDLPGRACHMGILETGPHLVVARSRGGWMIVAIDPVARVTNWSSC